MIDDRTKYSVYGWICETEKSLCLTNIPTNIPSLLPTLLPSDSPSLAPTPSPVKAGCEPRQVFFDKHKECFKIVQ